MNQKVVAFLPCRRGSTRVPNKNTRPFGVDGLSLLEIKLEQLGACPSIHEIILSTNDQAVRELGEQVASRKALPLRIDDRPDHLGANDTTTDSLIEYVPSVIPDGHILWTHVTSPFVDEKEYSTIIASYFAALESGFDSLMTGTRLQTFLFSEEGPVNYDRTVLKWPRTQTLPVYWEINSAAFIVERNLGKELVDRIGQRPRILELSPEKAFDIDTWDQFELGTKLWAARKNSSLGSE